MGAMAGATGAPHAVGKQYAQLQQRRAFSTSYDAGGGSYQNRWAGAQQPVERNFATGIWVDISSINAKLSIIPVGIIKVRHLL